MGNHWGMDGVSQRGSVDSGGQSMVGHRSGVEGGGNTVDSVGKRGGVEGRGNTVDSMGQRGGVDAMSNGHNSGMSDRDGPVGSDGGLDLRESLGVVGLGHAGVGGSEGLGLDEGPLLAVGGGDGLVAGLASDNSVAVVAEAVAYKNLRGSGGSSEDCSKANKGLQQRWVSSQTRRKSLRLLHLHSAQFRFSGSTDDDTLSQRAYIPRPA
jgi:hypothetical protein